MCSRAFETRSRPPLSRRYPRGLAFYVAFPKSSIRPLGLPIYVARVPAAPFSLLPSSLCLLCRSSHSLHSGDVMANEQTFAAPGVEANVSSYSTRPRATVDKQLRIISFGKRRDPRTSHSDVATATGRTQPVRLRSRRVRHAGQADWLLQAWYQRLDPP